MSFKKIPWTCLGLFLLCALPARALPADAPALPTTQPAAVALVPWPRSLTVNQGRFLLNEKSRIVTRDSSLNGLAAIVAQEMRQVSNLHVSVADGTAEAGDILPALDPSLKGESYVLDVTERNATIRGANYNAVAMGTVTLLQSLDAGPQGTTAPAMNVSDEPQSPYCGMMVDVARRYNSIDSLKQIVILCRLYKIRFLHLHLTDDQAWTFPSKAFPNLGKSPQFLPGPPSHAPYTIEELTGLVKFADERGVTIVPEIEMPGHSGSLQRDLPEIFGVMNPKSGKKAGCGVINIANDDIYPALDTLIGEVCDVFKSSPYFHMGSDECYWPPFLETPEYKEYAGKTGLKTPREMVGKFAGRIDEMVKKHGKRLISWESYGNTLNKDVVIMAWRAGHEDMIKAGYQIINVPWVPQVGYTVRANYEWSKWSVGPEGCTRPTEMARSDANLNGVLGAQQVLWESSGDVSLAMLRQTAAARNEQVYNPFAARGYADFAQRLKHTDVLLDKLAAPVGISVEGLSPLHGAPVEDRSDSWGPNAEPRLRPGGNIIFNKELTVTLSSLIGESGAAIHYTLDGSDPTATSPVYTAPFKLTPDEKQLKQAINGKQPTVDMTIRARLYSGEQPISFARVAIYKYNLIENVPQTWAFTVYQADSKLEKAPADFAGLKLLYHGTASIMHMSEMQQFNFPPNIVAAWEGKANFKADAEYTFRLRSFAGTSQLFVDGKLLVDRTAGDWGQDLGKVQLQAGTHDIKVIRSGAAGYQSLVLLQPDGSQKPLDMELVK